MLAFPCASKDKHSTLFTEKEKLILTKLGLSEAYSLFTFVLWDDNDGGGGSSHLLSADYVPGTVFRDLFILSPFGKMLLLSLCYRGGYWGIEHEVTSWVTQTRELEFGKGN